MDKKLSFIDCGIIEKEVSAKERSITQYASVNKVDRDNDIVEAKGIDLKNYRKNPIVLFNHDRNLPIGSSMWQKADDKGLLTKTTFSKTPFADDIYTLHLEKVLNAWSIGFMPKLWKFDEKNGITTFTDIELFEYSSVTLPANPGALDEAKSIVKSVEGLHVVAGITNELKVKAEFLQYQKQIDDLLSKMSELEGAMQEDTLLSSIEKLENEIDRLNKEMVRLSFKILNKDIKTETLGIDVKKLVSEM